MPGGDGQVRRPRLPDAGWLPDPSVIGVERWWNGRSWTSRTRDAATGLDCVDPRWTVEAGAAAAVPAPQVAREVREAAPTLAGIGGMPRLDAARRREGWYAGFATVGLIVAVTVAYVGMSTGTFHLPSLLGDGVPAGPAVEYPVFGSDAFSLYLARSLVAQDATIDVSWLGVDGAEAEERIDDAMLEVAAQNPYVYVDAAGWTFSDDGTEIIPSYRYADAEAERRRAATSAVVQRIVGSDEVTQADGDVELITAIHDALVVTAEFDDAAFAASRDSLTTSTYASVTQSQEAYGALVAGEAVGEGYAKAFQALARAVGYEAVVVTGTATDGEDVFPHAWNRIRVAGTWMVVDAAWDDVGVTGTSHEYLLLDRYDPLLDSRAIDADWVLDDRLWNYGA